MRRTLLLVPLALLTACSSAPLPPAPLVWGGGMEGSGWPLLGTGPSGTTLRFIERGRFEFGLTLRNRTHRSITLLSVQTPQPPDGLVQQESTRFVAFNPPPCTGRMNCPGFAFQLGHGRRAPYTLQPGRQAGVTLGYRLGSCAQLRKGANVGNDAVVVTFRYGSGRVRTQRFPLGDLRLRLRPVPASACDQRPHSDIAVTGPYATSSDWTIPYASAWCTRPAGNRRVCAGDDTCAHGVFRSGVYQSPGKPAIRVEIDLRAKRVTVWVGIGLGGWTPFHSRDAVVGPRRFHATVGARYRPTFRVYGAWRCATGG